MPKTIRPQYGDPLNRHPMAAEVSWSSYSLCSDPCTLCPTDCSHSLAWCRPPSEGSFGSLSDSEGVAVHAGLFTRERASARPKTDDGCGRPSRASASPESSWDHLSSPSSPRQPKPSNACRGTRGNALGAAPRYRAAAVAPEKSYELGLSRSELC